MRRFAGAIACTGLLLGVACGSGSPAAPSSNPAAAVVAPPPPVAPVPPAPVTVSTYTFTIDSACRSQFPETLQERSYTGASGEYGGMVHLQGNFQFASGLTWNMVYRGSRDGGSSTYVGFNDPPLWERLSADSYFLIYGNSEYKSTSEYGEWPFWGRVTYCASQILDENPKCAVPEITCESARHRLRVLRN